MSMIVSYRLADMYKKYDEQAEERYVIDICRKERFDKGEYEEYHSYYCSKRLMPNSNLMPPNTEDEIQGFIQYAFKTPEGAERSYHKVKDDLYCDIKNEHYEAQTQSFEVITLKEMLSRWRAFNEDCENVSGIYYYTKPVGFKYKEEKVKLSERVHTRRE